MNSHKNFYSLFLQRKLALDIFILILIKTIISEKILFDYKYSKIIELIDDKYLMCTNKGIYIYDSNFQTLFFQFNFTTEIKNRDQFEFTTLFQYPSEEGGGIIVLTKTKVYYINSLYSLILEGDVQLHQTSIYYTLIPYKDGNDYNFIIGYLDSLIKMAKFTINIEQNSIINKTISKPELPYYNNNEQDNSYHGYSCNIMISEIKGKVLTCFYEKAYILGICSFDLENLKKIDELCNLYEDTIAPAIIRSEISEDKKKALVCYFYSYGDGTFCLNYDIDKNEKTTITKYLDKCSRYPSSLNIYYSKKSKEYVVSCYDYVFTFSIVKFDENFNEIKINSTLKYDNCGVDFVSILYDYENNIYSFIASCGDYKAIKYNTLSYDFIPSLKPIWSEVPNNLESKTENIDLYSDNYGEEEEKECSKEFLYHNKKTNECLKICNLEELLNNTCFINNLTHENIENITQEIRKIIYNTDITPNINIILNGGNSFYQIITSNNMEDNNNNNLSIIDFGECETRLKEKFGIDYLIFLKIDTFINSNSPNLLNYEVYNPKNLKQLNLSICDNLKIQTYSHFVPSKESLDKFIKFNESGHDVYNINDSFYQDLCLPFTTDNGTDILLSDRKTDFYDNISLCQKGCTYSKYDYIKKKVKCECMVRNEVKLPVEFDENSFLLKFIDDENFSNIKLLKCYKLVFSKEGQTYNLGSYIFLSIILVIIVLCVLYRIFHIKNIVRILRKIINNNFLNDKNNINNSNIENNYIDKKNILSNKNLSNPLKKKSEIKNTITIFSKRNSNNQKSIKDENIKFEKITDINKSKNNHSSTTLPNIKRIKRRNAINISSKSRILILSKDKEIESKNKKENKNNKKEEKAKETNNHHHSHHHSHSDHHNHKHNYNDEELNELEYKKAIKYDKRTLGQYYCSLIKKKHLLFFTFFNNEDYNVFILKLALFFFSISLYFTVNAIFFTDKNVHSIYERQGRIDLLLQIPNIIYSATISLLIGIIIKILALSYKDMLKIKQIDNEEKALRQSSLLLDKLILKFNLFFVICFIFLVFFWYFISAFCAVYKNTQKMLFKNTLSSLGLSMLYPFGLNLIPVILRIPSLQKKSKCNDIIYRISKLVSYI